nr:morphogenetic protein [Enterobacter sp. DSM 30060]
MIFNSEMVRAILDGRKTQTRRIMKIQPEHSGLGLRLVTDSKNGSDDGKYFWSSSDACGLKARSKSFTCPFGVVGDRIWVRETFQGPLFDYEQMESYLEDSSKFEKPEFCQYAADGKPAPEYYDADDNLRHGWRPSIHMPRWASRILLEITDVRVERLASVSDEDAGKEGYPADPSPFGGPMDKWLWFRQLWDGIYPEQSFKHNPWVWVIEFKRVEGGAA